MNEPMDFLASMIGLAKSGGRGKSVAAVDVLRDICRDAADAAPPDDLVRMAQFLYDLRLGAERN